MILLLFASLFGYGYGSGDAIRNSSSGVMFASQSVCVDWLMRVDDQTSATVLLYHLYHGLGNRDNFPSLVKLQTLDTDALSETRRRTDLPIWHCATSVSSTLYCVLAPVLACSLLKH